MSETLLSVDKLTKDYDEYRAVDNISFNIEKGKVMGLLGPNGAGKSTTIQMLLGITELTSGKVTYFDMNFAHHRQECLQRINYASAYNTLMGRLTVKENLLVFANMYLLKNPHYKISELLEYFEISRMANMQYWDLSAGERTRVNLAKSLLNDPELILMDEPTASLDPDIADKTLSLIEDLRLKRKLSILFTSHNMSEVTRICDQVIFLEKGHIVSQDTPANLISHLKNVSLQIQYKGSDKILAEALDKLKLTYQVSGKQVNTVIAQENIGEVIATLTNSGLHLSDVEIKKPTLEDVFLEIARRKTQ